jgi:hypothetical protein
VDVGLLMGCGSKAAEQTPPDEAVPVVSFAQGAMVAEAVVEPARWFELRFDIAGEITEAL